MFEQFRNAWKIAKLMKEQEEMKSITPMDILPVSKSNKAIWKEWSTENAIRKGYKASTWVYACISRIAKTTASVPWIVYQETPDGLEVIPQHPLELLLRQPNPYMSGGDFMERIITHLYLGGNSLFSKVRANNIVAELWPISPDQISPIPSKTEFISGYEYKANQIKQIIPPEDIVHVMFVNPSDLYWGMSPLQAVSKVVDTDNELLNFQMSSLQNRAISDGVFSFKQPLTRQQWEEARAMVREQHMGANNTRTPWILGGDATWTQMSLSPAELDFIESRGFGREEICSVFSVPPPMIGLYENATLNNIETARKIFWVDTIIPLLDDLKSAFNLGLIGEFGEGLVLDYDLSNVQALQDNYNEKVETAERLFNMGVPFNQINKKLQLGFDEVDGGDVGYLPLNVMAVGRGSASSTESSNQNSTSPTHQKMWNLQTDEQKTRYWKAIDSKRERWMEQFAKRVKDLFEEEGEAVAKAFERGEEEAFEEIDAFEEKWRSLLSALMLAIIEDFGNDTFNELKATSPQKLKAFNPWARNIQEWISSKTAEKVTNVLDTTKDLIRNVIAESTTEGVRAIARKIKDRYQSFSNYRAETIARTETVMASNYGSYASAKQTGLNPEKVWISSRDSRVRDTHEAMDGIAVDIDELFDVDGDQLLHPGDPNGKAENVINCRCTMIYRTTT